MENWIHREQIWRNDQEVGFWKTRKGLTWLNQPFRGIIGNLPVWAEFDFRPSLNPNLKGLAGKIRPGNLEKRRNDVHGMPRWS
jgi:hypothetical protein